MYLGGLGDTLETASSNLDRFGRTARADPVYRRVAPIGWQLVDAAFAELDGQATEFVIHGSGLRELRIGKERFAVLPGAAMGRYARDERQLRLRAGRPGRPRG